VVNAELGAFQGFNDIFKVFFWHLPLVFVDACVYGYAFDNHKLLFIGN